MRLSLCESEDKWWRLFFLMLGTYNGKNGVFCSLCVIKGDKAGVIVVFLISLAYNVEWF